MRKKMLSAKQCVELYRIYSGVDSGSFIFSKFHQSQIYFRNSLIGSAEERAYAEQKILKYSAEEPYMLHKRALYTLQKSTIYSAKEPCMQSFSKGKTRSLILVCSHACVCIRSMCMYAYFHVFLYLHPNIQAHT